MRIAIAFLTAVVLHFTCAPAAMAQGVAADVIVVVDTSGSMDDEVAAVRSSLNAFAVRMQVTSLDLHVILIGAGSNLCIPAPLGSGACPADEALLSFAMFSRWWAALTP